jgi:hypothetical protein
MRLDRRRNQSRAANGGRASEGRYKQIIHQLADLESTDPDGYGPVVKCYERAL